MRIRREEAQRALELLEDYHRRLESSTSSSKHRSTSSPDDRHQREQLRQAIERIIKIFRSSLFQALLDIQEFYEVTLQTDDQNAIDKKTSEALRDWEDQQPSPDPKSGKHDPVLASDVQDLLSGRLNEILGAVLKHQQSKEQNCSGSSSRSSSLNPLERIDQLTATSTARSAAPVNGFSGGHHTVQLEEVTLEEEEEIEPPPPEQRPEQPVMWEFEEIILERGNAGLGFSIAGGTDNPHIADDSAIYITKLIPGGSAAADGRLQIEDIILKVNDTSLIDVSHEVAVNALQQAGNRVQLLVKRRKASPAHIPPSASAPAHINHQQQPATDHQPLVQIELFKATSKGLGFSIAGGVGNQHLPNDDGIYVTKIMEKGAAALDGRLECGDRLVAVNDVQLDDFTHEEAVTVLKSTSDHVILTVRKAATSPSGRGYARPNGSGGSSTFNSVGRSTMPTRSSVHSLSGTAIANPVVQSYRSEDNLYKSRRATDVDQFADQVDRTDIDREPRRVTLTKGQSTGLGFNIVGGEDGEGIFISFIMAGGPADLCCQLYRGDQILAVNGEDLRQANHEQAAATLKGAGQTVSLLVAYRPEQYRQFEAKIQDMREQMRSMHPAAAGSTGTLRTSQKRTMYVRALFDYEPSRDSGLPSRGLPFKFGDILHVTNASDDEWWQARRVLPDGTDDSLLGIIPSKHRVERRERARVKSVKFHGSDQYSDGRSSSSTLDRKKKNFSFSRKFPFMKSRESSSEDISGSYDHLSEHDLESARTNHQERSSISGSNTALEEIREDGSHSGLSGNGILSYQAVTLAEIDYVPPVIILGPLKERLNDDLISEYPDRFGSCVPHTTRPPKEGEKHGRDYYFVASRDQMERDIEAHLFIEAGQYRDNLYGTSVSAVRELAYQQRKHCILDVSAAAIRRLQAAGLMPIAILVRPKTIDQLKEWDKRISDEEARRQFERAIRTEQEYGRYFTAIISDDTPEDIYHKVKKTIQQNSGPSVWVPAENQKI